MTVPAASQIQTPRPARSVSGIRPYRLTVRQFESMVDAGIFRASDHVELLGGMLVDKMTKNYPHHFCVVMLAAMLRKFSLSGCFVLEEKSIRLDRWSRPEPDIAIIRGDLVDFRGNGPQARDVALLIEVADSSYAKDRGVKWGRYAASAIPEYWIVNLALRRVEVHSQPLGKGHSAIYSAVTFFEAGDDVPVVLGQAVLGQLKVVDVLP